MPRSLFLASTLGLLAAFAACSSAERQPGDTASVPASSNARAGGGEDGDGEAGDGDTVLVEMITDETGNYFKPSRIEAERGDVIRFTLTSGVHNVNFLPDSNAGKPGLAPPSDMLQLPGQTYDLRVTIGEGAYYFQCDPHAALGMTGRLEVGD